MLMFQYIPFKKNVSVSLYTSSDGNSCIQTSDQYDVRDSQDETKYKDFLTANKVILRLIGAD